MQSHPYFVMSLVAGLLAAGPMTASGMKRQPATREASRAAKTIRFDLYEGHFMVVQGSIGPMKHLNFFVDTGTSVAVVDSRIGKKLKLGGGEATKIVIVGGRAKGEEAVLPSIEIGPVRRMNLPIVVTDLSFFDRTFPVRIDGIVGLDVLGQIPFVIDYAARDLSFGADPELRDSVPLRLEQGLAVIDAEIDHAPVRLLFDTGASALVLFNKSDGKGSQRKDDAMLSTEDIGNFETRKVWLRTFRMGPEEFREEPALMTANPKPSQIDFDGLMSPAALGISRVQVDVKAGTLAFSR